jgi:hypothetical protein
MWTSRALPFPESQSLHVLGTTGSSKILVLLLWAEIVDRKKKKEKKKKKKTRELRHGILFGTLSP